MKVNLNQTTPTMTVIARTRRMDTVKLSKDIAGHSSDFGGKEDVHDDQV